MAALLFKSLFVLAVVVTCFWLISLRRRDASIIDWFWGTGFTVVAWLALTSTPLAQAAVRSSRLVGLTTIWGTRLTLYLSWRNWGRREDRRYRAMRDYHGPRFWWVSFLTVFLLQGRLIWIVSMPIQVAMLVKRATPLGWLDGAGICLWSLGFFFETVSDYTSRGHE